MKKELKALIEYPKEGVLSKSLVKGEKMDCTLFCMAAGTQISEHTSTKQGFVQVLEGKGIFNLGGEEIEMKDGTFIYMKENEVHSLSVEKNTSFLLVLT